MISNNETLGYNESTLPFNKRNKKIRSYVNKIHKSQRFGELNAGHKKN